MTPEHVDRAVEQLLAFERRWSPPLPLSLGHRAQGTGRPASGYNRARAPSLGTVSAHHLAQINIGRLRHPLEAPETVEFTDALDRINAVAEASPGFVWRLTDGDGNSSSYVQVAGHEDPLDVVNYSIWTDLAALKDFVYRSNHMGFLRRRTEWFEVPDGPITALWWVPAGTIPPVEEAYGRLDHLRANGPSEQAWSLTRPLPPPAS